MTDETQQQTCSTTPEEDIRELYSRTAKLNDAISALLSPAWGSEAGIIPTDHPLYVGEEPSATEEEQAAPVDWQAIVRQRERELKLAGEARHRAEADLNEARQWARHGYELGQRSCTWSDHGVAPAWLTEGWPLHFDGPAAAGPEEGPACSEIANCDGQCCNPAEPSPDPFREQLQAEIESEIYEYRERTMFWEETVGVTEEIARLATRGAMKVRDRELGQLREQLAARDAALAACTAQLVHDQAALAAAKRAARGIGAWGVLQAIDNASAEPAHDGGPTVAEAKADDASHWNGKYDRP